MIFKKADSALIIVVILLVSFAWWGGKAVNTENSAFVGKLPMFENNFVEHRTFNEKLNKMFPYYEPDGTTYKRKIATYFEQKEAEAGSLYKEIIDSIPNLIEWEGNDGKTFLQPPTNFMVKEDLQKLHLIFPEYRKLICQLREERWQGGSGRGVAILSCEIYEMEKYIDLLKFYREQFISSS